MHTSPTLTRFLSAEEAQAGLGADNREIVCAMVDATQEHELAAHFKDLAGRLRDPETKLVALWNREMIDDASMTRCSLQGARQQAAIRELYAIRDALFDLDAPTNSLFAAAGHAQTFLAIEFENAAAMNDDLEARLEEAFTQLAAEKGIEEEGPYRDSMIGGVERFVAKTAQDITDLLGDQVDPDKPVHLALTIQPQRGCHNFAKGEPSDYFHAQRVLQGDSPKFIASEDSFLVFGEGLYVRDLSKPMLVDSNNPAHESVAIEIFLPKREAPALEGC